MAIEFEGKTFCLTGGFSTKQKDSDKPLTRKQVSDLVTQQGGIIKGSVTKGLDYLVVGGKGSILYSSGTKGDKIIKAEEQPM